MSGTVPKSWPKRSCHRVVAGPRGEGSSILATSFVFSAPADLCFGAGTARQTGERLQQRGLHKALVITDRMLHQLGVVGPVLESLQAHQVAYAIFDAVEENPADHTCEAAAALYRQEGCDCIVGVGGGSPMDTAKLAGVLAANGGKPRDYEGRDRFAADPPFLVLIPTTAGTASEVTFNAVITDTAAQFKFTVFSPRIAPQLAICDPELTMTKPAGLTAATGMDALTHAVESFINNVYNPLTWTLAAKAIDLIAHNLREAIFNPGSLEARTGMLLGSTMAGMAFNITRLGNVHAMSHPLSALFGVPHGVANSILLTRVIEWNLPACVDKCAEIADLMGENTAGLSRIDRAYRGVEAIRRLSKDVGIPDSLAAVRVDAAAIPRMVEDAMRSGNVLVNPRKTSARDLQALYEWAMRPL